MAGWQCKLHATKWPGTRRWIRRRLVPSGIVGRFGPPLISFSVIQSQNAEVGYLYQHRFHVDEEKCAQRFLVDVVQAF